MKFNFSYKKIHCFLVFNFVLFLFSVQLFSMQKQKLGEGYFSTGSVSDPQHIEAFYSFIKELPRSSQKNLNSFVEDYKKSSNSRDLNAILRFGYLKGVNGNLKVEVGFAPSRDSFEDQHAFFEGGYSIREEQRILFCLDDLESNNKIEITPINQKKERPKRKLSDVPESTQDAIDLVHNMGTVSLTSVDKTNRKMILNDVASRFEKINWIDLSSLDISSVEQTVLDIDDLLEIINTKEPLGNLAPWRAIRNAFSEVTAIDGLDFENKQYYAEKVKWIPFVHWVAKKIGSHKDKWALNEALKHSRKLLEGRRDDIEIEEARKIVSNINETISKIIEESVVEEFGEELSGGNSDLNSFNSNVFLPQPTGVVGRITQKILNVTKSPRAVMAFGNAFNAGVQNAFAPHNLMPAVKNAATQIKKSFSDSEKSLIADFEKEYVNPYIERSSHNVLVDDLKRETKSEEIKFGRFVESKIISTRIELDDFYEECLNLNVSRDTNSIIYFSNEYSKDACGFVKHGLDLADDFHSSKNYEMANDFTDISTSLLDAAKGTAKFFKLVGEGSFQALSKYKNPLNVIKEFGEGFINLGIGLSKATLKFAEFASADPETGARMALNFINSTANKLKNISNDFSHLSYEEKVVLSARILTECVLDTVVVGGAFKFASKTGKFFKALPSLVKKEAAVAKLATRLLRDKVVNFKEVLTPLSNAVMETKEFVQIAGTNGIKLSKASLEIVSKNKGLITAEGRISKAVSKVIKKTNKTKNKFINLASEGRTHHINIGEKLKRNRFGGGHEFPGNPGKTVFPKPWSKEKIMHEISDIATDPNLQWIPSTRNGQLLLKGKPEIFIVEGVRDCVEIRVIVEPAGNGIVTGFPLNGVGVTCKSRNI